MGGPGTNSQHAVNYRGLRLRSRETWKRGGQMEKTAWSKVQREAYARQKL